MDDAILKKLHKLARKLYAHRRYRVEFLSLMIKNGLEDEIESYRAWDRGYEDLGPRQIDSCFEMGDSQLVIADLIGKARKENFLDRVKTFCETEEVFMRWLGYADKQAVLF